MVGKNKIVVFILFSLMQTAILFAQSKIKLIDKSSSEAIYLAHVKFSNIKTNEVKWAISDEQGVVLNPFHDSTKVEISYTGYEKKTQLLAPNEVLTIKLETASFGLNELVVTANFIPVELKESVYDVKTISEEKIASKGAPSLREVLNTELNFRTNNGHVNETSINLNGLSGNHVKIMVDGVPVEGRLSGNIDLSQLNLNEIEKIEVIDGPTSVAYGTNALAGTINLITKKNQLNNFSINLKSYYESVGQYNVNGNVGFKIKENQFKISGGRNFFDGFANPDTSRFKTWKPREQYFGSFLYNRRIKHLKLSYILDAFTETMTSRGERRAPYYITAFDTYYNTQRLTNKLLLNGRISPNYFIDLTLSHAYFNRTRNIYFKDLTTLKQTITDSDSDQDTTVFNNYLFRGVFTQKNDSIKLNYSIGTELKRDDVFAQRVIDKNQWLGDYALFTTLDYKPIKAITIKPAVRYAYNTRYQAPIVPSLNLLLDVNENLQFKTSYAKGFRAPDLKELYLEFHYNSTINLWGNTNLIAENSDHFNFSAHFHKKINNHQIQFTPKVYYSKINNLISLVQTSDVDWTYQNVDFLTTRGTSFLMEYRYKKINLNVGYNFYGNYNSMFDQQNFKNKFFYTNDVNSSVALKLDSLNLSFNLNYKYTGLIRNNYLTEQKEIKESYIGDYHTFDFSLTKLLFNKKLSTTLGVKNIFDVKEVLMVGDVFGVSNQSNATSLNVLWGRSYFVSLNYNF
ncbi:MAG: Vitamin B12 transporter BtuB [Flavobacteriales bacterium]|nr:Vitamin B12 transporter BtuB [Flavobacteriales bacterium]